MIIDGVWAYVLKCNLGVPGGAGSCNTVCQYRSGPNLSVGWYDLTASVTRVTRQRVTVNMPHITHTLGAVVQCDSIVNMTP